MPLKCPREKQPGYHDGQVRSSASLRGVHVFQESDRKAFRVSLTFGDAQTITHRSSPSPWHAHVAIKTSHPSFLFILWLHTSTIATEDRRLLSTEHAVCSMTHKQLPTDPQTDNRSHSENGTKQPPRGNSTKQTLCHHQYVVSSRPPHYRHVIQTLPANHRRQWRYKSSSHCRPSPPPLPQIMQRG